MKSFVTKIIVLFFMLCGLPLLGVWIAGYPVEQYLEFPPATRYVQHAPLSWKVFCLYALFIFALVLPFVRHWVIRHKDVSSDEAGDTARRTTRGTAGRSNFPWWGSVGAGLIAVSWVFAWLRFPWFDFLQNHTFTPLWIGLILVINALCYARTGFCLMLARPRLFLLLFPVSALFWWFFEYLNRFAQNWYYVGGNYGPIEYFFYATLPFSTVLPAVLSLREWMLRSSKLDCFSSFVSFRPGFPRLTAMCVLAFAGLGLTGIGVWTNFTFSLLWISPVLIIISLETLMGERHVLSDIIEGNWKTVVASALAALVCGFFWEMWNVYSQARWIYSIPYVHVFKIFEMPLLGWAGYLPFGLECAVVAGMVGRMVSKD